MRVVIELVTPSHRQQEPHLCFQRRSEILGQVWSYLFRVPPSNQDECIFQIQHSHEDQETGHAAHVREQSPHSTLTHGAFEKRPAAIKYSAIEMGHCPATDNAQSTDRNFVPLQYRWHFSLVMRNLVMFICCLLHVGYIGTNGDSDTSSLVDAPSLNWGSGSRMPCLVRAFSFAKNSKGCSIAPRAPRPALVAKEAYQSKYTLLPAVLFGWKLVRQLEHTNR